MDNFDLLVRRLKSFGLSLVGILGTAIVGFLVSPDFVDTVFKHFGETSVVTTLLLLVPEIVKHRYNVKQLGKVRLGSVQESDITLL